MRGRYLYGLLRPATFSVRFAVTFWLTSSLKPLSTDLPKPAASADTNIFRAGPSETIASAGVRGCIEVESFLLISEHDLRAYDDSASDVGQFTANGPKIGLGHESGHQRECRQDKQDEETQGETHCGHTKRMIASGSP